MKTITKSRRNMYRRRATNGGMISAVLLLTALLCSAADAGSAAAGGDPYFFYDGMTVFFSVLSILLYGAADCFAGFRAWAALPVYDDRMGPLMYDDPRWPALRW